MSKSYFPELDDRPPNGIRLETTAFAPAANEVFTPEELDVRIAAHRERVFRELPECQRRSRGGTPINGFDADGQHTDGDDE